MIIPILITSLIVKKEYEDATRAFHNSLISKDHILDISIDSRLLAGKVSEKINDFLDFWRGKEYKYIGIFCNDLMARPETMDLYIKSLEDNPDVDVGIGGFTRDKSFFDTPIEYNSHYSEGQRNTAVFIFRKGIIEKVGNFNAKRYPFAMNERDYFYRCKLAGLKVATTDMNLFWHPEESMTKENRGDFNDDTKRYIYQWGGLDLQEKYTHPFNNPSLDYTWVE